MANENLREPKGKTPEQDANWMALLFGQGALQEKEVTDKQKDKIALFEKGLSMQLKKTDTIDNAMQSMVKVALAAEFGPSFLHQKGAKPMVQTICQGILSDPELRSQAMIIIDRYAK